MLNLQLSKQLKDKGFPQGFPSEQTDLYAEYWCSLDGADPVVIFLSNAEYTQGFLTTVKGTWMPVAKCPQLGELIGFAGKEFFSVVQNPDGTWTAWSTVDKENTVAYQGGSSPEEAVANLILRLI